MASWLFTELLQKVSVTIVFIVTDLSVANNLLEVLQILDYMHMEKIMTLAA